jgi:hypothetical protein
MKNKTKPMLLIIVILLIFILIFLSGCETPNNTPTNIIKINNDTYESIQAAINAANDSDTINIGAGVYHESLIINKTINLQGAGSNKTIIDFNQYESVEIININANSCKIDGLMITSSNYIENDTILTVGIRAKSSSNIISNNSITNLDKCIEISKNSNYNNIT